LDRDRAAQADSASLAGFFRARGVPNFHRMYYGMRPQCGRFRGEYVIARVRDRTYQETFPRVLAARPIRPARRELRVAMTEVEAVREERRPYLSHSCALRQRRCRLTKAGGRGQRRHDRRDRAHARACQWRGFSNSPCLAEIRAWPTERPCASRLGLQRLAWMAVVEFGYVDDVWWASCSALRSCQTTSISLSFGAYFGQPLDVEHSRGERGLRSSDGSCGSCHCPRLTRPACLGARLSA